MAAFVKVHSGSVGLNKPCERYSHAMTVDKNGKVAYMFGGYNKKYGYMNDLWSVKC